MSSVVRITDHCWHGKVSHFHQNSRSVTHNAQFTSLQQRQHDHRTVSHFCIIQIQCLVPRLFTKLWKTNLTIISLMQKSAKFYVCKDDAKQCSLAGSEVMTIWMYRSNECKIFQHISHRLCFTKYITTLNRLACHSALTSHNTLVKCMFHQSKASFFSIWLNMK